ncbi:response regulator [bacterium]|nr:response regulator [bacterium]
MKILVIDDEKNIRHTLRGILEDEGYEALTAETGEEGLGLLQQDPCELVFLDVKLPGIDGLEVLKRVRQQFASTEVVMISGHGDIRTAVEAVKKGAVDFLVKTVTISRVTITARNVAGRLRLGQLKQQKGEDPPGRYRMSRET